GEVGRWAVRMPLSGSPEAWPVRLEHCGFARVLTVERRPPRADVRIRATVLTLGRTRVASTVGAHVAQTLRGPLGPDRVAAPRGTAPTASSTAPVAGSRPVSCRAYSGHHEHLPRRRSDLRTARGRPRAGGPGARDPLDGLRLRLLPRGPGRDHRPGRLGRRCGGADAHRRREVAV